jgi:hypothetical protein
MSDTAPLERPLRRELPPMHSRTAVGGIEVSPVCLGIVGHADVVPRAVERGCNFFFVSCDMHWPLYEHTRNGIAAAIREHGRESIVVTATVYVTQREFQIAPFVELLEAIPGLSYLDVVVAGGAYPADLLPRLDVLHDHVRQRRFGARATAASLHDRGLARMVLGNRLVDLAFVRFNAAHVGARSDVFPHVADDSPPVYIFKSTTGYVPEARFAALGLTEDDWRPRVTDHYRYVLSYAPVKGVLCSVADVDELEQLDACLRQPPLTAEECVYLENLAMLSSGRVTLQQ